MKYDAFISYRHTPLDKETAKMVHTGLETYHVPGSVRSKTGKKRISRVFRDEEELPIGSDLNDNIRKALSGSEFLIVICTPDTRGSIWVQKEIETFIALHGRHNILAVLAKGEPAESFPEMLLEDENGKPVEPLAADIRGETRSMRKKKFRTELLRLAAPILGCSYDDLRQRHRERKIRRAVAFTACIAVAVAAVGTAFGIYNADVADKMTMLADEKTALADEKTRLADEILVHYREKQKSQSGFLAKEALLLLAKGEREGAVIAAASALPGREDRPFVAEAQYALAKALYAYDIGETYGLDRILKLDSPATIIEIDNEKRYLTVVDSGMGVYFFDADTFERITKIEPVINEDEGIWQLIGAYGSKDGICVVTAEELLLYDHKGNITQKTAFGKNVKSCLFNKEQGRVYCIGKDRIYIMDLLNGSMCDEIEERSGIDLAEKCVCSQDGRYVAFSHYKGMDEDPSKKNVVSIYDTGSGSYKDVEIDQDYVSRMCFTPKGNLAVLMSGDILADIGRSERDYVLGIINIKEGRVNSDTKIRAVIRDVTGFISCLDAHEYDDKNEIVVSIERKAWVIDENSGDIKINTEFREDVRNLNAFSGSHYGRVAYDNGVLDIVDLSTGNIIDNSRIETGVYLNSMVYLKDGLAIKSYSDAGIYILTKHEAYDLEKIREFDEMLAGMVTSPDGGCSAAYEISDPRSYYFFDGKGNELFRFNKADVMPAAVGFYGDRFIYAVYEGVYIIRPYEGDYEYFPYSEKDKRLFNMIGMSRNGRYAVCVNYAQMIVFDMKDKKCVYDAEHEGQITAAVSDSKGKYIYAIVKKEGLVRIEIKSGKAEKLADIQAGAELAVSPDDRYAAVSNTQGKIFIVDISGKKTEKELNILSLDKGFMEFTADGGHLFVQGDDRKVRIISLEDYSIISSFDIENGYTVKYISEDDNMLAVGTGYDIYLIDKGEYGLMAYIEGAMSYLYADSSFIMMGRNTMYRTMYKDYKKLLEESRRQFG